MFVGVGVALRAFDPREVLRMLRQRGRQPPASLSAAP
jgi:hypothetical protein